MQHFPPVLQFLLIWVVLAKIKVETKIIVFSIFFFLLFNNFNPSVQRTLFWLVPYKWNFFFPKKGKKELK